jgi:Bacterial Ig-like domain
MLLATAVALLTSGVAWPLGASAAEGVPVTYLDHSYNPSVTRPSEDKPQSKLWYTGGTWWALMVNSGGSLVHIHELMPDHTWRNTGVQVDTRVNSTGDALWSPADNTLFVASRATGSNLQVNRFSYNPTSRSWAQDAGFPVSVDSGGGSESATIDRDSQGLLWVTYTRASRVWVAHSTNTSGTAWTAGFLPAVPDTVIKFDDLSALIAFGTSVGVMWSDQESGAFRFAIHRDGDPDNVWRTEDALVGPYLADDHLNLKQLVGGPQGRVYAAIKTSANDSATASPGDTLVGVLTRTEAADGTGTWALAPAGTVADDHTRPLIMIDSTNQELYFFATAPGQGGDIFYKKTPLSNVQFGPGRGTPFVDAAPVVNNATGAKDPVTAQTGLVVLAVAEGQKRYVHAEMQLAGGGDTTAPTATTSPAAGATGVAAAAAVTATFSEAVQGVSGSTFTLKNTASGAAVSAAVTYDATNRVATLDPAADLAGGTQYTATLTGGTSAIRDAANNPLATVTWNFTTAASGDTAAPTVTARTPAVNKTGFSRTGNVTATFSEAVQNVTATTFTLKNATTGASVSAVVSLSSTTNKWILNPGATLAANTKYTATITGGANGVKDLAGNPLAADVTWSFTTGA